MKFKRIISMLLAAIMMSTMLIAAFPTISFAANSAESGSLVTAPNMYATTDVSFGNVTDFAKQINYGSALEMLEAEDAAGQLVSVTSSNKRYSIYVNPYTGFMYYKDNATGQVLMSNSYNYNQNTDKYISTESTLSQIEIEFSEIVNTAVKNKFNSYKDSATLGQISVNKIQNGIRVNYTIGDTTLRYLAPGTVPQDRYYNNIILSIIVDYVAEIDRILSTTAATKAFYGSTRDFTNYLEYYNLQDKNSAFYGKDELFIFAATVMQAEYVSSVYKERTEFVAGGYKDEFNARFRNFAELLSLTEVAYKCAEHGCEVTEVEFDKFGNFSEAYCDECEDYVYGEDVVPERREKEVYYCFEHSYRAADADEKCPECGHAIETPTTTGRLLFYDKNGKINADAIASYVQFINKLAQERAKAQYKVDYAYLTKLITLTTGYDTAADGDYVKLVIPSNQHVNLKQVQAIIEDYCVYVENPTYGFNDMYKDEKACGYVNVTVQRPVFRCALEYTFNPDGSLSIALPANSISFDETTYILRSITPLKYLGAGSLALTDENGNRDGYFLYPDGSGTVISFNDFTTATFSAPVYGIDHAYSDLVTLTGDYHEQITMPVYGAVTTEHASPSVIQSTGKETLNNGFFSVIEEGAALTRLHFSIEGTESGFAAIYATYQPYSLDEYDLSTTLSVSNLAKYTMVSETRFSGSYVTRVYMLQDEALSVDSAVYREASYAGMAATYREYLKGAGVISAIAEVGSDLPLYIEAFGSMEVVEKILSFPVEVSKPLTTFEDVKTMYDEFANAKNIILAKAQEYEALAAAEEKDIELKNLYIEKAAEYRELHSRIENITNINFRLTGFANGGMRYTYPAKVKWERSVGGKRDFKELLEYSRTVAQNGGNLGIYPEFDFIYITNTAMFDGIYPNGVSSKLIDNRYAQKQLYNSVTHAYEASLISLISADSIGELYEKFNKDYSKFYEDENGNVKGNISVSTLGSDLNSNFDDETPVNRDEASIYVSEVLASMKKNGYDIMVNKGNSYSIPYATHILDAYIDSSHLRYSSYPVPFFGMTLHGYVNYAGNALNYSGDPQYDILRSIENGASLYYILCYENTAEMKDDLELNKYYGVDYATWFEKIVDHYDTINDAIGSLQNYEIVSHKILKVERAIDEKEREAAYEQLVDELIAKLEEQVKTAVNGAYDAMKGDPDSYGRGVKVTIDEAAIVAEADKLLNLTTSIQISEEYAEQIRREITSRLAALEEQVNKENMTDGVNPYECDVIDYVEAYESKYDYVTDSRSDAGEDYDTTKYTVNNYNVVMVTYRNAEGREVSFVLNYNIYGVIVNLGEGNTFVLDKYGFKSIS